MSLSKLQEMVKGREAWHWMVGWHHQLNGHEFEQYLGVGNGQGSLVCCSPWGNKELDIPERLNCLTELNAEAGHSTHILENNCRQTLTS